MAEAPPIDDPQIPLDDFLSTASAPEPIPLEEFLTNIRPKELSLFDAMRASAAGQLMQARGAPEPESRGAPMEFARGLGRGLFRTLEAGGGLSQLAGHTLKELTPLDRVGAFLEDWGEIQGNVAAAAAEQIGTPEVPWFSPAGVASTVGEAAPQLAQQVSLAMLTGGASLPGLAVFMGTAAAPVVGHQYREALEAYADRDDLSEDEKKNRASIEAGAAGLITAATNYPVARTMLKAVPGADKMMRQSALKVMRDLATRSTAGRILQGGAAEALQETTEQVLTDTAAAIIREDPDKARQMFTREYLEGLGNQAIASAILGSMARGGIEVQARRPGAAPEAAPTEPLRPAPTPPPVEPPPTGQVTREQLEAATPKLEPSEPAAPPAKPAAPRTAYLERIADAVQEKASPELLGEIAQQEEGVTPAQFKQLGIKKIPSKPRRIEIANIIRERTQQPNQVLTRREDGKVSSQEAETKPQGLYLTIGKESPHEGKAVSTFQSRSQKPLNVPSGVRITHERFGTFKTGEVSAGIAALKELASEKEFERLRKMRKGELAQELQKKFPGADYGRQHDAYELLEAYGAQLARQRGYDAIVQEDPSDPKFSEFVALKPSAIQEVPRAAEAAEAPAPAETQAAPVQEEVTEAPAPRGKAVRFRSKRKGVRFGELLGPAEREGFLTIALPDGGTVDVKQDAVIGEEAPAAVPVEQKAEVRPAVQGKVTENEVTVAQRPAEAEGARGETTDVKGERHLYEQPDPDSLESHLRPGEPFESMGAAENPDYEVGPGGAFRAIVRTAKDLMGPDTDKAPSQKYASPNEKIEETYQEAAQGIPKKRFAQMWTDFKEKVAGTVFRRSFYHLPINEENAEARSAIREHRFAPMYAFSQVDRVLQRITKPLDHDSYDLFQRSVWVNSLLEPTESGALPRDMNRDELKAEQERLKAIIEDNEAVKAAIEYRRNYIWDRVVADYVKAHQRIGVDQTKRFYDVDEQGNKTRRRPDYYRHQVLLYYALKEQEAKHRGDPSKYGPKRGRGWLKTRKGTSLPVNAMYLQAEHEVLYQMILDTQRANALGRLIENYDVRPMMMEEAKRRREQAKQFLKEEGISDEDRAAAEEEAKITWEDLPIPEGYVKHYLERGNNVFPATSLDDRLATQLFEEIVEELNITKDDLNKVLALGAKKPPIIIPARLARQIQMEEANTKRHDVLAGIDNTIQFVVRWMKKFQLLGPRRFPGYNLRNLSEVEKVMTINPGGFKEVPRAIKSLFQLYFKDKNKISDPDLEDWIKRGGAYTLWRVQELEQIPEEAQFRKLLEPPKKGTAANLRPDSLWRKYWDAIGLVTEFREAILRYANYLNYLEQIRTHGHPRNYGASHKENIQGLSDQKDQAFQLAADLLIDYSDASAMDEFFRKRFWPYWMFAGKNFAGYIQATKNLWNNDQAATKAGRAVLKKLGITGVRATPLVMMNVGRIAIMWYGFQALTALWNRGLFPDEDDELPDEIKRQPHITLGRDSEGKPRVFPRVGTALDALEWFGADSAYYDFRDLVNGRRSFQEIVEDMVYSPVNKFMNGVSPLIKAPFELAAGQSFYPDVRRPRRIRDPGEHLSRIIGFHDEYRRLSDRPQRESYGKSLLETPFTRVEPNQAHYWFVADKKRKFLEQQGRGLGYSDSARGDALYNYKLAVRFDDKDSAAKALAKYFALQGTAKGLNQSLESLHPLSGLNDEDEKKFIESLRAEELDRLDGALRFYEEVLNPSVPFDISTLPSETARRDAIAYFSNQLIKGPPSRKIPRDVREGKVIEYEEDKRKAANMFKANDMTRKGVLDAYRAYLDEDWRSPTTGKPMSGKDKAKRIRALRIELRKQGID